MVSAQVGSAPWRWSRPGTRSDRGAGPSRRDRADRRQGIGVPASLEGSRDGGPEMVLVAARSSVRPFRTILEVADLGLQILLPLAGRLQLLFDGLARLSASGLVAFDLPLDRVDSRGGCPA